ncbi:MAG: uroporphyrinogen decarboxylase/cobalamine-independent methonine synthase family protein [Planctomycetota bacterium]
MTHSHVHDVLNDPDIVAARDAIFARLEAVYAGECFPEGTFLSGIEHTAESPTLHLESWLDQTLAELAERAEESTDTDVLRPLCLMYNPRGVHFIDHLFGADVFELNEGNWQSHPLPTPIGQLQPVDLDNHPTWQRMKEFARMFVERDVKAVLFGLPTIGSTLNASVNLYGQALFEAMLTEPEAARHDLRIVTDLLCELHRWYRENIPTEQLQCVVPGSRCQPVGFGQICGCTCQLLSPGQYAEFIAPLDKEVLSIYPRGGMIHLCGTHTQHIPTWRNMVALRAVQINDRAAEDLETYVRGLRDDQVFYVNTTDTMTPARALFITSAQRIVIPGEREA